METSIFSMVLDALMIVAITGLWIMWFQQAEQRKKVEKLLVKASDELKEATQLLDHVMDTLSEKQGVTEEGAPKQETQWLDTSSERSQEDSLRDDIAMPDDEAAFTQKKKRSHTEYSAQIMRLNREGLTEEEISEKLDVPVAQVRLMILLQAPKV